MLVGWDGGSGSGGGEGRGLEGEGVDLEAEFGGRERSREGGKWDGFCAGSDGVW